MTEINPLREEVYTLLESVANDVAKKDINMAQDIKTQIPKGIGDKTVQIFQVNAQSLNISTTVLACVQMLRAIDKQELEKMAVYKIDKPEYKIELPKLFDQGINASEAARRLGCSQNYAQMVRREWKAKS